MDVENSLVIYQNLTAFRLCNEKYLSKITYVMNDIESKREYFLTTRWITILSFFHAVYANQVKIDQFCNEVSDPNACNGTYYGRLGFSRGKTFGCFCETELSHDLNFNFGEGNYNASAEIEDMLI